MRGARAFAVLTAYLLLMAGFALTLYVLYVASLDASVRGTQNGLFGRTLFQGVVGIELFLITFIVPAFTAGAITGERERQTYDLLRTTLIKPRALVVGKLLSALAYVFLLLLAAIPLQSLAFLFGGVSISELLLAFVILLITAITIGTIGIYFSCTQQRTLSASVASYGAALLITIGLPLGLLVVLAVGGPFIVSVTNGNVPATVQVVLLYGVGLLICTNPLATAYITQLLLINQGQQGFFTQTVTGGGVTFYVPVMSPWIVFAVLYLLVSALLLRAAIKRVERIEDSAEL
jgi:ABC-type transport system involved in multi-copper enzyme maturation permease subunit